MMKIWTLYLNTVLRNGFNITVLRNGFTVQYNGYDGNTDSTLHNRVKKRI